MCRISDLFSLHTTYAHNIDAHHSIHTLQNVIFIGGFVHFVAHFHVSDASSVANATWMSLTREFVLTVSRYVIRSLLRLYRNPNNNKLYTIRTVFTFDYRKSMK